MAQADFIPSLWTARIESNVERLNVFGNIVTTDYLGEIAYGNKVVILAPKEVTVREYTGNITWEQGDADKLELTVDRRPYFAVKLDDLTVIQSDLDLLDKYATSAASQLVGEVEREVVTQTAAVTAITTTSADLFRSVAQAAANLNANRVSKENRWTIVSPDLEAQMLTDARFVASGDEARQTGVLGKALGFDVYSTPEMPEGTALFGGTGAIAMVGGIEKIDTIGFENSFDIGLRGYYAFGVKVINAKGVGRITVNDNV